MILLLAVGSAEAGESVVLASGSRLHVDRHESEGSKIRLYQGQGFVEMDAALVQAFEEDESVPQAPALANAAPASAPVAAVPRPMTPGEMADAAADKYGLPRKLVRSVMAAESGFAPNALSPKGAVGLMQLMPATALSLGVDPNDPAQNVDGGTRYLRDLLQKYDGYLWHALAAYNAGPGAVDKYNGVPPYRETIHYVWKIDQKLKKADD
ncbi:MAG TPA: lytic transglycosylase domain-containing protein [Bryobacteraceae bacterium]